MARCARSGFLDGGGFRTQCSGSSPPACRPPTLLLSPFREWCSWYQEEKGPWEENRMPELAPKTREHMRELYVRFPLCLVAPLLVCSWYEEQEDPWEKDGMPRAPPKMPERGLSRTFTELLPLIFLPQDAVEEELTFEEKVFRFTSQATVSRFTGAVAVAAAVAVTVHSRCCCCCCARCCCHCPCCCCCNCH